MTYRICRPGRTPMYLSKYHVGTGENEGYSEATWTGSDDALLFATQQQAAQVVAKLGLDEPGSGGAPAAEIQEVDFDV